MKMLHFQNTLIGLLFIIVIWLLWQPTRIQGASDLMETKYLKVTSLTVTSSIVFKSNDNREVLRIQANQDGSCGLSLNDKVGNSRVRVEVASDGSPKLSLADSSGQSVALISVDDSDGFILLSSSRGDAALRMACRSSEGEMPSSASFSLIGSGDSVVLMNCSSDVARISSTCSGSSFFVDCNPGAVSLASQSQGAMTRQLVMRDLNELLLESPSGKIRLSLGSSFDKARLHLESTGETGQLAVRDIGSLDSYNSP